MILKDLRLLRIDEPRCGGGTPISRAAASASPGTLAGDSSVTQSSRTARAIYFFSKSNELVLASASRARSSGGIGLA